MVEEALQALKDMVVAHYADSSEPLYLATVGQRLPAHRKQLVDKFRSLAGAVKHLGSDELGLITPSGQPGRTMVVTPGVRANIEARFGDGKDSANGPAAVFSSLPTPIQIAFCLKTDPGETVAIRTTPPIRYLKLPEGEPAPAGFVVVEPKYRSAGLKLANASITDLERLGLSLNRWAADHQVDTDRLTQSATPANAFERFRVVQDPRVLPHIVLPADIVSILLRHS
jgi:hypothetical protein